MRNNTDDKSYTIEPIVEADVPKVMDLLKRTFYVDEPLNQAVQLYSQDEPCPELDEYCTHSLLDGLSFKAVDRLGNIVGVTISGVATFKQEDSVKLLNEALNCTNPKFQKIFFILANREESAKLWTKYPDDQYLVEVKVAATDHNWRRLGIMKKLVEETEKTTKERGIRILRIDTSSAYSAKAAERLGFTCLYKAPYTDIQRNGIPLIIPKFPHVDDRVYIKILS